MSSTNTWYFILVVTFISFDTLFSFLRMYNQKITKYMKEPFWDVIKVEWWWILWSSIKCVVAFIGLASMYKEYPYLASMIVVFMVGILYVFGKIWDKERGFITRRS